MTGDLCLVITTPNNRIFHFHLLNLIPILLEDMKCSVFICKTMPVYDCGVCV